jgi:hypothetical protein
MCEVLLESEVNYPKPHKFTDLGIEEPRGGQDFMGMLAKERRSATDTARSLA